MNDNLKNLHLFKTFQNKRKSRKRGLNTHRKCNHESQLLVEAEIEITGSSTRNW